MIVRLSEADQFHDFDRRGGMVRAANGVGRLDEAFGCGSVSRQRGRTQSRVHGAAPRLRLLVFYVDLARRRSRFAAVIHSRHGV